MKPIGLSLVAVGLCCAGFGYWGVFTVAGRSRFDEMAGIVPMAAMAVGAALALAGVATLVWSLRA